MAFFYRIGLFACAISAGIFNASSAPADSVVQRLVDEISLEALDKIIEDASFQINLLKSVQNNPEGTAQAETEEIDVSDDRSALRRTRADLLCFADNFGPQKSPEQLDAYFDGIESGLRVGQTLLTSFDALKPSFSENNCNPIMVDMADTANAEVRSVSIAEMSVLVLHLETCWPDEGVSEADGSDIDMDARYYRARDLLRQIQRVGVRLDAAQEYCG